MFASWSNYSNAKDGTTFCKTHLSRSSAAMVAS